MHNTGQKSYTVVCQEKILSPEVWEKINTTFMARILVTLWMGRVNVEFNERDLASRVRQTPNNIKQLDVFTDYKKRLDKLKRVKKACSSQFGL